MNRSQAFLVCAQCFKPESRNRMNPAWGVFLVGCYAVSTWRHRKCGSWRRGGRRSGTKLWIRFILFCNTWNQNSNTLQSLDKLHNRTRGLEGDGDHSFWKQTVKTDSFSTEDACTLLFYHTNRNLCIIWKKHQRTGCPILLFYSYSLENLSSKSVI